MHVGGVPVVRISLDRKDVVRLPDLQSKWSRRNDVLRPYPIFSERLNDVLRDAAVRDRFAQLTVQSQPNKPAEFAAFVNAETEKWGKIVREGNIKPD